MNLFRIEYCCCTIWYAVNAALYFKTVYAEKFVSSSPMESSLWSRREMNYRLKIILHFPYPQLHA